MQRMQGSCQIELTLYRRLRCQGRGKNLCDGGEAFSRGTQLARPLRARPQDKPHEYK